MWFLVLSGLIAHSGQPVSSSCPVVISPPRVVVEIGDRFSANCTSTTDQVEAMGWESANGGTSLTTGVSFLHLNIDSVTFWRSRPICFINLKNGTQCERRLAVTVYKTPDSVSLSQPSQMGPVIEGEKYRMQCDIVNVAPISNLSVQWHKVNNAFYTETFDEFSAYPVNESSVLNLTAHRDDNGAQIWCEAKLDFGTSGPDLPSIKSQLFEVIVLYPPTFANPEHETLEIPAGSKFTLNCTATGNPMPTYSWHFPNPMQLMKENQNSNQSILSPSYELPGTYNCTASNSQGATTKYFTVIEAPSSHPGTTAGILLAVFLLFIFILAWDRTTFAALVGGFVSLGVLLFIGGLVFVTRDGTFSFRKGSYARGRPTSSGVV